MGCSRGDLTASGSGVIRNQDVTQNMSDSIQRLSAAAAEEVANMSNNIVLVYSQDDHDIFGLGYYWQNQDSWRVTQSFKTKVEAIHAKKEGLLKWEPFESEDKGRQAKT